MAKLTLPVKKVEGEKGSFVWEVGICAFTNREVAGWRREVVGADTLRLTHTSCRPGLPRTLHKPIAVIRNTTARSMNGRTRVGTVFPGACNVPIIAFSHNRTATARPFGINVVLSNNRTPNNRGIVTNLCSNIGSLGTRNGLCNFLVNPNKLISRGCVRFASRCVSSCHGANNFSVVNSNHAGLRGRSRFRDNVTVLHRLGVGTLIVVNNSSSGAGTYILTRCCTTGRCNIRIVNYPGAVSNSLGGRRVRASFNFSATYGACTRLVNGVRHSYGSTQGC